MVIHFPVDLTPPPLFSQNLKSVSRFSVLPLNKADPTPSVLPGCISSGLGGAVFCASRLPWQSQLRGSFEKE